LLVRRLRLADEEPIFVGDSYLSIGRFPALKEADYGGVSLSRIFGEAVGTEVDRARQWIGATAAPKDVAVLLELEEGAPVLEVKRVSCVFEESPVEYVEALFHPGRYQHYNELSPGPDGIG
jgi:GntR family transcriptional regulator